MVLDKGIKECHCRVFSNMMMSSVVSGKLEYLVPPDVDPRCRIPKMQTSPQEDAEERDPSQDQPEELTEQSSTMSRDCVPEQAASQEDGTLKVKEVPQSARAGCAH